MNKELQEIINQSTFEIIDGTFIYAKVRSFPEGANHFLISKDDDEITVVTKFENVSDLDLIERNKDGYTLISLNVSVPFYSVGFLAAVSGAIAEKGLNILIVSTYSKDYILVKADKSKIAEETLIKLGFKNETT
jgi:hypothetical protein